jgi:pilus assembly protein CpaB
LKNKAITMIGIAIVVGGASVLVADLWLKRQAASQPVQPAVPHFVAAAPAPELGTIVVADEPLRFGAPLSSARLKEIPWHEASVPHGAFRNLGEIGANGDRVVISPIEPNEPILLAKLSGPDGRATLSNRLSPGMRAVTIRIDEVAGVGGFVTPGDHVDVVLTRDAGMVNEVTGAPAGAAGSTIASEIVVENVRVLSVGQAADERATNPQVVGSVTIEVSAEGAKKIALARSVGTLSLSLRAVTDYGSSGSGLTTISSFSGSAPNGSSPASEDERGSFFDGLLQEENERVYRTVIVTRGLVPESYRVVAPED